MSDSRRKSGPAGCLAEAAASAGVPPSASRPASYPPFSVFSLWSFPSALDFTDPRPQGQAWAQGVPRARGHFQTPARCPRVPSNTPSTQPPPSFMGPALGHLAAPPLSTCTPHPRQNSRPPCTAQRAPHPYRVSETPTSFQETCGPLKVGEVSWAARTRRTGHNPGLYAAPPGGAWGWVGGSLQHQPGREAAARRWLGGGGAYLGRSCHLRAAGGQGGSGSRSPPRCCSSGPRSPRCRWHTRSRLRGGEAVSTTEGPPSQGHPSATGPAPRTDTVRQRWQASSLQTGPTRGDRRLSPVAAEPRHHPIPPCTWDQWPLYSLREPLDWPGTGSLVSPPEHLWACPLSSPGTPGLPELGPGGGHSHPRSGPAPGPHTEDRTGRESPDPSTPVPPPALVVTGMGVPPPRAGASLPHHTLPQAGGLWGSGCRQGGAGPCSASSVASCTCGVMGGPGASALPRPWPSCPPQVSGGSPSYLPRLLKPKAGLPGIVGTVT